MTIAATTVPKAKGESSSMIPRRSAGNAGTVRARPRPMVSTARLIGEVANSQVTAIPVNTNIIYIGTAWGGVWLTRDGGTTWAPLFKRAPALVSAATRFHDQ
ncbi:hypothetical protein HDF09_002770 [Edaphobacter lichenicola]|uniref:Glycosyl hydrolase n=1 Tax=Tunturiibacter empetritectus TaxID=3069691 RepID=A0A7W8IJ32_9BACT|nr:hypothetical protein [Edaphobacter lichenicola]